MTLSLIVHANNKVHIMTKNKSTIIAFLVAPLIPASIGITQTAVFGSLNLTTFFGLLPIFYLFSVMATVFFGAPLFLIFRRYKMISWLSSLVVGIVVGALAALIFFPANTVQISGLILMSSTGGAAGLFFWLIWSFGSEK